jgi:hypothetical protein
VRRVENVEAHDLEPFRAEHPYERLPEVPGAACDEDHARNA